MYKRSYTKKPHTFNAKLRAFNAFLISSLQTWINAKWKRRITICLKQLQRICNNSFLLNSNYRPLWRRKIVKTLTARIRTSFCNLKQSFVLYLWARTLFVFESNLKEFLSFCIYLRTLPSFSKQPCNLLITILCNLCLSQE